MKKEIIQELNHIYEQLVENEVIIHYESNGIPYGEVTYLQFKEDDTVSIEISDIEKYEIEIDDFIENHTKTGVNYHSWNSVRRFDTLLEKC